MLDIVKTKRFDRFNKPKYQKNNYKSFVFGKSLKSINLPDLFFTNYVKSENNECYKMLEGYVIQVMDGNFDFFEDDFEPLDEIKYTEPAATRLLKILHKGYKLKYDKKDLIHIHKVKSKYNKKFQLFIKESRNNLTVILIDFFHLGIIASYQLPNGKTKKMKKEEMYNKEKYNKYDLINIVE